MKKFICGMMLGLGLLFSGVSQAAPVHLVESPMPWRLQNYTGNILYVFYTGSRVHGGACYDGRLTLPSNATTQDRNRFWDTVLNAKIYNKKVILFYESTNCIISSFGLAEG